MSKVALLGEAGLPPEEVALANQLLFDASVFLPGSSLAAAVAAYDARGDTGGKEGALFEPIAGRFGFADLLRLSATVLSDNGYSLNIDLDNSPLTLETEALLAAYGAPARERPR